MRWTSVEVQHIIERCLELRKASPDMAMRKIVEKAQDSLPSSRRRPVHPPLVSWANKAMAQAARGAATRGRKAATPETSPSERIERPQVAADPTELSVDSLVRYGIRAGASVLAGVLRDPIVQQAIAELVSEAMQRAVGSWKAQEPAISIAEQGAAPVKILGLTDQQASEFARAYRGILRLAFYKGDSVSNDLRSAIAEGGTVIAMEGSVSTDVVRLLRQLVPDYIRHTNGLSGLRQRLADMAMSGGVPSAGNGPSKVSGRRSHA